MVAAETAPGRAPLVWRDVTCTGQKSASPFFAPAPCGVLGESTKDEQGTLAACAARFAPRLRKTGASLHALAES